jgi:alginate O-acetyltransferase complex protein AlgI
LGKKVLIANTLAVPADTVFDGDPGTMAVSTVWLGIICYALQIYFDFSGYSDMAIGLARMFGIRFKENFNYPYIARTMSDFWRRWHISLSTWFRDYLYIPLGGNRVAPARVAFNLVLVFLLCGFWHGASWNFLVWGAYHGLFLMVERWGPMERFLRKIGWGGHVYTVLAVMGGWIFFRAHDMTEALEIWARAVGLNGQEGAMLMPWALLEIDERWLLVVGVIACLPVLPWLVEKIAGKGEVNNPAKVGWQVVSLVGLSLVWAVSFIQLTAGTFNPFIYFRF